MTFLYNSNYSINYFEQNSIDKLFCEKTYYLSKTYPFKWYHFINKIIGNKLVTYFKDTTMIVNLIDLDLSYVRILFEIIKEYYKDGLLSKVLYEKEYIVVDFISIRTKEVFEKENMWMSIYLYYKIKENYDDVFVYLRGVIRYNNSIFDYVDLIIKDRDKIYLVNSSSPIINNYNCCSCVYLYNERSRFIKIPEFNNILKFSFDQNQLLFNFERMRSTINSY